MIKAVVFDLDDTLISEKEYVFSGFNAISKEISYRYNLDSRDIFSKMNELFKESSKNVFNRVLDYFNIDYLNEEIMELISIYRNHKPNIKFFGDVIPTINILRSRGIKTGIITDGYKETQLRKIEALNCRELFDEIIVTDELGREFWKPHEKAYRMMAERLDVNFDEMIYVGDNEEKDFVGANKLGIITFKIERLDGVYSNNKGKKEFRARYIIKEFKDLFNSIIYNRDFSIH